MDSLDPLTRAVLGIVALIVLVAAFLFPLPSNQEPKQDRPKR